MKNVLLCSLMLLLAACQSSHVLVGAPRPPIDPAGGKVYLQPPSQYEQVALLEASSAASGAFTRQQKTDKVISRLKAEAAALGAPRTGVRVDFLYRVCEKVHFDPCFPTS